MQESNFWLGGWTHVRAVGRALSRETLCRGFFWQHCLLLGKGAEWEADKKKWKEVPSAKCYMMPNLHRFLGTICIFDVQIPRMAPSSLLTDGSMKQCNSLAARCAFSRPEVNHASLFDL